MVWLLREAPASVLAEIGLPRDDLGIDLIARLRGGMYWPIQAKFRSDQESQLGWGNLSTFTALSAAPRRNIALTVVAHTSARPVGRRELTHNFVEIGLDAFRQADWSLIRRTILENVPARPNASEPDAAGLGIRRSARPALQRISWCIGRHRTRYNSAPLLCNTTTTNHFR
jgi:hypothetical protein